jgi:hypothetical protein
MTTRPIVLLQGPFRRNIEGDGPSGDTIELSSAFLALQGRAQRIDGTVPLVKEVGIPQLARVGSESLLPGRSRVKRNAGAAAGPRRDGSATRTERLDSPRTLSLS